jgi:hypothetical protein
MPATIIGTAGATWGLSAETGVLIQRQNAKTSREKNLVRNHSGEVTLVSFYNPTQEFSMEGVTTGSAGLAAAVPGIALTLANSFPNNGVDSGSIYTGDVDVAKVNTDFQKITVSATRWPLI